MFAFVLRRMLGNGSFAAEWLLRLTWIARIFKTHIGVIIGSLGVIAFGLHLTTVNPHHRERVTSFVTSGIYRLSRNPMYLGLLFVLCSWAVYLANWDAVLLLPFLVMYMTRFQIKPEERVLTRKFGDEYMEYTRPVRRWV